MRTAIDVLYTEILDYMNEWYPFQVRHVLLMGPPVETTSTPFAMVTWNDPAKISGVRPLFHLNHENVTKLVEEERVFVVLHETYHVLLNHNCLPFGNLFKANVAADIVINDYLMHCGLPEISGLYYGENSIGFDSFGLTVKEVYDLLPDDLAKPIGSSDLSSLLGPGGSCGQQHYADNVPEDVLDSAPESLKDARNERSGLGGRLAGSGSTDMQAWADQAAVSLRWAEILKEIQPSAFGENRGIKRRTTFNKLNRKVAYGAPNVILPVYRDTKLEGDEPTKSVSVVLAIDTSGSISSTTRNRFLAIAKSIPKDKVSVRTIGFHSRVYEVDMNQPRWQGGGTAFGPIETWIKNNCDEYPDAVFIFTDGKAYLRPLPKNIDRWSWFLCDHPRLYDSQIIRSASRMVEPLERFVK